MLPPPQPLVPPVLHDLQQIQASPEALDANELMLSIFNLLKQQNTRLLQVKENQYNTPTKIETHLDVLQYGHFEALSRNTLADAGSKPLKARELPKKHHNHYNGNHSPYHDPGGGENNDTPPNDHCLTRSSSHHSRKKIMRRKLSKLKRSYIRVCQ